MILREKREEYKGKETLKLKFSSFFFFLKKGRNVKNEQFFPIEQGVENQKILILCPWTGGKNVTMQNKSNKDWNCDFGSNVNTKQRTFFLFSKATKINKTVDVFLNVRPISNSTIKTIGHAWKKKQKINYDSKKRF